MNTNFQIQGIVRTANQEYAIAGVIVRATVKYLNPTKQKDVGGVPVKIGEATTDSKGMFIITPGDQPSIQEGLCLLGCATHWHLELTCYDKDEKQVSDPFTANAVSAVTELLLHEFETELPADHWKRFSTQMRKYQTARFYQVVKELMTLGPSGMFVKWSVHERVAALTALESAALDPGQVLKKSGLSVGISSLLDIKSREILRQKLANTRSRKSVLAFDEAVKRAETITHLAAASWFLNPDGFTVGDVSKGVNGFKDQDSQGLSNASEMASNQPFLFTRNLLGYRDYLVEIWTNQPAANALATPPSSADLFQELNNRFHQDFKTKDLKAVPANQLLITLLLKILQEPAGPGFGFGIAPSAIDPQNDMRNREYLDYLIKLSGVDIEEVQNRYRLDLSRSDFEMSNPVQQNVDTIQRFFTDSFQSVYDPFNITPRVLNKERPIIYSTTNRRYSPFFWEYEEWLTKDDPFFGEIFFDIRKTFDAFNSPDEKEAIMKLTVPLDQFLNTIDGSFIPPVNTSPGANQAKEDKVGNQWERNMYELQDRLNDAHGEFFKGLYGSAEDKYVALIGVVSRMGSKISQWKNTVWDVYNQDAFVKARRAAIIDNAEALSNFEKSTNVNFSFPAQWYSNKNNVALLAYVIDYLKYILLPACVAESEMAQGKYEKALRGELCDIASFQIYNGPTPQEPVSLSSTAPGSTVWWISSIGPTSLPFATDPGENIYPRHPDFGRLPPSHIVEIAYFKGKTAEAMLQWADSLFRTNLPEKKARARELYKGVLFLYNQDPGISPLWGADPFPLGLPRTRTSDIFYNQTNRARVGFEQINAGLNYYGLTDNYVTPVRYQVLKDAADRLALSAHNTQTDFLNYIGKFEQALIDEMAATQMIQKASYSAQIAAEQVELANFTVSEAQKQVENVKAQIAAKEKEIKDSESLFEQGKALFNGMKDAASGLGSSVIGQMKDKESTADTSSIDIGAAYKVISSKGSTSAATAGLTGGMAIMAGYGAFAYAGYMSMSGMADADAKRSGELKSLQQGALPAAQKMLELKKREVKIAQLNKQIAEGDHQLGKKMLAFYGARFENKAFWQKLAELANRNLRRYLDLGGRAAWFAERALSFEIDRNIRIVSFDYFPNDKRGVTGADRLQLDLAEIEAVRMQSLSQTIPVKQTFSLARDFPLSWGMLKKDGVCDFRTTESSFNAAYPGVYGYRIRCISVGLTYTDETMPHKGLLQNDGISSVSASDNTKHQLIRYADAFPLSEFNMRNDMAVYELPDQTLMPFEGSGIDTSWRLKLWLGHRTDLQVLTDVLVTFDMRARYSYALSAVQEQLPESAVNRSVLISGESLDSAAFAKFKKEGGILTISFEPGTVLVIPGEKRKISVLGMVLSGVNAKTVSANLHAKKNNVLVNFTFDDGIAMTNTGIFSSGNGGVKLPLNKMAGLSANQSFVFTISTASNPGLDFSKMNDVQLFADYEVV